MFLRSLDCAQCRQREAAGDHFKINKIIRNIIRSLGYLQDVVHRRAQTQFKFTCGNFLDLFHNGGQIKYSFVLMLISPTNLVTTSKFQKNICFKTMAVGLKLT